MSDPRVLIVEPDEADASALIEIVRVLAPAAAPVRVLEPVSALERLTSWDAPPLCIIFNESLTASGGLALKAHAARTDPPTPVVLFNGGASDPPSFVDPADPAGARVNARWTLDVLPDRADPYDGLVRELAAILRVRRA